MHETPIKMKTAATDIVVKIFNDIDSYQSFQTDKIFSCVIIFNFRSLMSLWDQLARYLQPKI